MVDGEFLNPEKRADLPIGGIYITKSRPMGERSCNRLESLDRTGVGTHDLIETRADEGGDLAHGRQEQ